MADTGDVIPVMDFKEHVRKLHMNDDYPFSDEYSVSLFCSGLVSFTCLKLILELEMTHIQVIIVKMFYFGIERRTKACSHF